MKSDNVEIVDLEIGRYRSDAELSHLGPSEETIREAQEQNICLESCTAAVSALTKLLKVPSDDSCDELYQAS